MHQQQPQQPSLSKRWACDRCRDHKLRCLRTQGRSDGPCVRCARAGASCVTGAPMPLGRSRASSDNTPRPQASRRPRNSVFVAVTAPGSTPQESTSTALPPHPEPDAVTESSGAHAQPSALSRLECFYNPLTADSGELPSLFLEERVPEGQSSDAAVDNALDFGFPDDAAEAMFLTNGRDQGDFTNSLGLCIDPAFQLQSPPRNTLDVASKTPEPSIGSSHVLARLAHLNEEIAHQLAYIESLVLNKPPTHLTPSCVDKVGDRQVNPILRALESTSALAAIIKQIISPAQDQGPLSVTTPVVLMCLSGHIQLLQIYNSMFCHVHRFLTGLCDISSFFENLPGFANISGLPPVKGDLYIKVVIQVAQHNISSLERAISLPPELCLSPQRAPSKSLLGYVDSPELFWSIMDQACSPAEKSARALVISLRTEIGNVLSLLTI